MALLRQALLLAAVTTAAAMPARAADALYDRLGGQGGVALIARNAVVIYTTDPRIRADFDNINPDRLRSRLADYLCQLADGPCTYRGRPMLAAHAGLETTQAKFNAVAEGMQTAMAQAGIPYWTQNRMMARLAPLQRDIVNR